MQQNNKLRQALYGREKNRKGRKVRKEFKGDFFAIFAYFAF